MEFMTVPDTYYQQLRENLKRSKVKVTEDLDILEVRGKKKMFYKVKCMSQLYEIQD